MLDSFCGVGTILQEALLEHAMVVGVDVNTWCVKAATENLEWLEQEYAFQMLTSELYKATYSNLAEQEWAWKALTAWYPNPT